jgi:uncharacterized SAM-binding protein YcdF (DUF218 family)
VLAVLAWLVLAALLAVLAGFVWFVDHLPREEPIAVRNADGIVVLTGRAARIGDAIELLAAKRGQRLLISGVYPRTTSAAIARLKPEHRYWVECCVDLDHSAVNTVGNAIQTRRWASRHGFRSLIVVTSNYHMPRALTEIAHQLPDVELIAFPIMPERMRTEAWWDTFVAARLLFIEYLKYLRAVIRTRTSQLLPAPNA